MFLHYNDGMVAKLVDRWLYLINENTININAILREITGGLEFVITSDKQNNKLQKEISNKVCDVAFITFTWIS